MAHIASLAKSKSLGSVAPTSMTKRPRCAQNTGGPCSPPSGDTANIWNYAPLPSALVQLDPRKPPPFVLEPAPAPPSPSLCVCPRAEVVRLKLHHQTPRAATAAISLLPLERLRVHVDGIRHTHICRLLSLLRAAATPCLSSGG